MMSHMEKFPLHKAVAEGSLSTVDNLLENGANINQRDHSGKTPLHIAQENNFTALLKFLLKKGADTRIRDDKNKTIFHFASTNCPAGEENLYDTCMQLIKAIKTDNLLLIDNLPQDEMILYFQDDSGLTPLHHAVIKGNLDAIEIILAKGPPVNAKNDVGRTALHIATDKYSGLIVDLLLKHKACPNAQDMNGSTPLHVATSKICFPVMNHPLQHENVPITPLLPSGRNSRMRAIDRMLAQRLNQNTKERQTRTPLHLVSLKKQLNIIESLLEYGADINAMDNKYQTPLHVAAINDNDSAVNLLLDKGAEVDPPDYLNRTPLRVACKYGRYKRSIIIQSLLNNNARIDVVDKCSKALAESRSAREKLINVLLVKHFIRMKVANLDVGITDCISKEASRNESYNSYQELCETELENLKAAKFEGHSLFEVFLKSSDPVGLFVCNKSLEEVIQSVNLYAEFPIYGSLIKAFFEKSKKRYLLLRAAQNLFSLVRTSPFQVGLPNEIRMIIMSYLDEKDLKNVLTLIPDTLKEGSA